MSGAKAKDKKRAQKKSRTHSRVAWSSYILFAFVEVERSWGTRKWWSSFERGFWNMHNSLKHRCNGVREEMLHDEAFELRMTLKLSKCIIKDLQWSRKEVLRACRQTNVIIVNNNKIDVEEGEFRFGAIFQKLLDGRLFLLSISRGRLEK